VTTDEKLDRLNRFMGWLPGQKCKASYPVNIATFTEAPLYRCEIHRAILDASGEHDIPPFNFYADTPEARERTLAIVYKVNALDLTVCIGPRWVLVHNKHGDNIGEANNVGKNAILDAIAEALKEREE
jgi:hypothetical protein